MKKKICFFSLLSLLLTWNIDAQFFEHVTVQEADSIIEANKDNPIFTIMDVRTPSEYNRDHLKNAYQRNFYDTDFEEQMDSLAKNRIYLIYCQSGGRSGATFDLLKPLGFQYIYNMLGGITEWKAMNLPVTTDLPPDIDLYEEVTTTFDPSEVGIAIYPNPFVKELTIDNILPNSKISFFDLTGKAIDQVTTNSSSFQYHFSKESQAVIIQIYHPDYKGMIIQKLIKQKQ